MARTTRRSPRKGGKGKHTRRMRGGDRACRPQVMSQLLSNAQGALIRAQSNLENYKRRSKRSRELPPFHDASDTLEFVQSAGQEVERAAICVGQDTGTAQAETELEALRSCANFAAQLNQAITHIKNSVEANSKSIQQAEAESAITLITDVLACRMGQAAIERHHVRNRSLVRGRRREIPSGMNAVQFGQPAQFRASKQKAWWQFW